MTTLQDKMQNIYRVKREIKNAIGTDSDVFSEYPDMIRSMAGGGVSYSYLDERLSYYVELTDLESMSYATESYVTNAISNIPGVDLSSYVSYTYLESKEYATESYVSYAINNIPAVDLSSYVTYTYLESKEYITINDIPIIDTSSYVTYSYLDSCGYITSNDLPVIDESIIPKQNNTYNLGSSTKKYKSLYLISGIEFSDWSFITHYGNNIHFVAGNDVRTNNDFLPIPWTGSKNINLGNANYKWAYTYTYNLILGNENINNIFPTYAYVTELINNIPGVGDLSSYATKAQVNAMFSYDTTTGTLTITTIS